MIDASRQYEAFGDRLAAADAAAQAVVAYQHAGLRGAAMAASATAERLAAECQGAQTPALRAATTPQPFTARQREIISLAAQGLSNKQIADRLTMSIRSIEGHLFRASQRVGANSREQLISLLHGPSDARSAVAPVVAVAPANNQAERDRDELVVVRRQRKSLAIAQLG